MTLGIAKPSAHGHDATNTPIPLYIIQQISQTGTVVNLNIRIKAQTVIVTRLSKITPLTK